MKIARLAPALVLAIAIPLVAQQPPARHTITHEDLYLMKRVGAPVLSPDGRLIVFSVNEPSYAEADAVSDLWLVPTDGSAEPRRLTNTKGGEGGVEWSPDSRRILFTARREGDEASQVYLLDVAQGGEAQRVTTLSTGASSPHWRPDGRAILFTSMIYPGAATDSANRAAAAEHRARKYNARVYDSSPIRIWDHWLDDRRPSLFVQDLAPGSQARDILAGSRLVAMPGFRGQLGSGGEDIAADWLNGDTVVFAATTNVTDWARADVLTGLFAVPVAGGEPMPITRGGGDYGSPRVAEGGRVLYATWSPSDSAAFHNNRIVRFERGGMGQQVVAGDTMLSVGAWALSSDARTIFFLSESSGHVKLFRVPAAGGPAREIGTMTSGAFGGLQVGGTAAAAQLAATWESAVSPAEVGRIDAATGRWTALSHFNADRVARLSWQPLREFWFTSSRGKRIHSFVALPPDFDSTRKYPLFVLIHGGAANMWTDNISYRWNYHLLGAPGYVMLMTDYTGSTGYGERFSQQIMMDPLEGPANEINEAADEAIRRYSFIDASRQVAGGASYGGHLTNWLAVTTTRYKALVSHAGEWDLETQWATSDYNYDRERTNGGQPPWMNGPVWRDQSPMRRAANLHTPVMVSVGERDFRVPMNNALEFWTALQRQHVPSRLIIWPTENHWVLNGENSRYFYREVANWMARWLNTPAATSTGAN